MEDLNLTVVILSECSKICILERAWDTAQQYPFLTGHYHPSNPDSQQQMVEPFFDPFLLSVKWSNTNQLSIYKKTVLDID